MVKNSIKASIVILDFLKSKRVIQNVESLNKQKTNFNFEIIIVDNSCSEENAKKLKTLEKFSNVQIHINTKNIGYIRANNQGAKLAKGEYILIVNPDIIWPSNDILQRLIDYMVLNPQVGILAPKQINDDTNTMEYTARSFPVLTAQVARRTFLRNMLFFKNLVARYEMKDMNYQKETKVDWIQSSFWVVPQKLWTELNGLNSAYFIFMSDPDFCFKVWEKGFEVILNPSFTVHADGRRASEGGFLAFFKKWTLRQHVIDALVYRFLHLFKKNPRIQYLKKNKRIRKN